MNDRLWLNSAYLCRSSIQALRHIRHFGRRIRHLLALLTLSSCCFRLLHPFSLAITAFRLYKFLYNLDGRRRPSSFDSENLAILVNDEDTSLGSLRRLLEPNRFNETGARVAEERVRQVLLGFERSVGFGAVGAKAVDRETRGRQRRV